MTGNFARRTICCVLALSLPLLLGGAGQRAPERLREFTPQQQAYLVKINAYLNAIHTLKSNFVQLGPSGQLDQGTLYIAKPGRMRFSYQAPSPILIVANGGHVYVQNTRLGTVDPYRLSDSPLGLLLEDNIDLMRNAAVIGVDEQQGAVVVRARTSANQNQSNIALVFSYPQIELRQWMVKDNQGGITTVALSGLTTGVPLDDSLFATPVKAPGKTH